MEALIAVEDIGGMSSQLIAGAGVFGLLVAAAVKIILDARTGERSDEVHEKALDRMERTLEEVRKERDLYRDRWLSAIGANESKEGGEDGSPDPG